MAFEVMLHNGTVVQSERVSYRDGALMLWDGVSGRFRICLAPGSWLAYRVVQD